MTDATPPPPDRSRLVLTRRGRLARTIVVALLAVLLILVVVLGVRALASPAEPAGDPSSPATPSPAPAPSDGGGATGGGGSDGGGASDGSPVAAAATGGVTAEITAASTEIPRSGMTGEGTWTVAEPATDDGAASEGSASEGSASEGNVRSYLLRVEDGIDLEAGEVAGVVAEVLADERGWQPLEHVAFRQVTEPAEADFTISLASPPTVDELCAPAHTNGLWSCRIGEEVVLNADRWTLMTPTFDDLGEYRAYMVNHEVGHFLGHGHETCGREGEAAPVMLQQSMNLGGCRANPWPSADGAA